ncbi:MAG: hypothetical protein HFH45_00915 [Bacilli bacterium]|jgi:hypothetical protein|nr:hypothetical protein [Bacilli bacterium]
MTRNLNLSKKMVMMLLAGGLSFTLVGCGVNETKNSNEENITNEQSVDDVAVSTEEKNFVEKEYDKVEGSNAVEAAITIMTDSASELANATDEVKQTESYQKTKEQAMDNFDTIFNFLFNGEEINGYTINDVSDSTVEMAKNSLGTLDSYIESYIPEYKEKAKEKLSDAGEWLWDKSTDLGAYVMDKGTNWLDDAKEKSEGKQR